MVKKLSKRLTISFFTYSNKQQTPLVRTLFRGVQNGNPRLGRSVFISSIKSFSQHAYTAFRYLTPIYVRLVLVDH